MSAHIEIKNKSKKKEKSNVGLCQGWVNRPPNGIANGRSCRLHNPKRGTWRYFSKTEENRMLNTYFEININYLHYREENNTSTSHNHTSA